MNQYYLFPCERSSDKLSENSMTRWRIRIRDNDAIIVSYLDGVGDHPDIPGCRPGPEIVLETAGIGAGPFRWLGDSLTGKYFQAAAVNDRFQAVFPRAAQAKVFEANPPSLCRIRIDKGMLTMLAEGMGEEPEAAINMQSVIEKGEEFLKDCPLCWAKERDAFWEASWLLYRIHKFPPDAVYTGGYLSIARSFYPPVVGHWDLTHACLDYSLKDISFASRVMQGLVNTFQNDGMMPSVYRPCWKTAEEKFQRCCSSPCVHTWTVRYIYDKTKDLSLVENVYKAFKRNLAWWETNRMLKNGLFRYGDFSLNVKGYESGYDKGSRFERRGNIAAVDLCGQIAGFYNDMSYFAGLLGEKYDQRLFAGKYQELCRNMRDFLWDEQDGFFYDYDLDRKEFVRIKTIAVIWALYARAATEAQAQKVHDHLANPAEFWTKYPFPSEARSEPNYAKMDTWQGPVWMSQNFWAAVGLTNYGYTDTVREIIHRSIQMARAHFKLTGMLCEFYHPERADGAGLMRKGRTTGPFRYYVGHFPIHILHALGQG